ELAGGGRSPAGGVRLLRGGLHARGAGHRHLQPVPLFPVLAMPNAHRAKQAFLLVVLGASFLPLLALLLNVQLPCALRSENRAPAAMPAFSWKAVGDASYFSRFEDYFNDHFGYRDWVIFSKHNFDEAVFRRVRPDLVLGKDGYLFY